MSRNGRIFLITHLYPLFTALELQYAYNLLGDLTDSLLYNIAPVFFIILIVNEWKQTSAVKLCFSERRSLTFFVYSFISFHVYYCLCSIENSIGNRSWVSEHNNFVFYFIILSFTFYLSSYATKRWRQ